MGVLATPDDPLRFLEHQNPPGRAFLSVACGVPVCKFRAGAPEQKPPVGLSVAPGLDSDAVVLHNESFEPAFGKEQLPAKQSAAPDAEVFSLSSVARGVCNSEVWWGRGLNTEKRQESSITPLPSVTSYPSLSRVLPKGRIVA